MKENEPLHGLNCPRCGGMISIPEGQAIVRCPFCDLRSVVQGDRGVRRYQVPQKINQEQAVAAFQQFLRSNMAISPSAAKQSQVNEVILVHLPFWTVWGRAAGWVFGQEAVGSGDNRRYEPRERRVVEDMNWNIAACDVGEFGVRQISLANRPLEPFQPDELHRSGMVFEPVGSDQEARETALRSFENKVREKADLERVSQVFTRIIQPRVAVVYYPLWVVRYLYRGRAFQVVVDGFSGEILYGKAPGNVLYRAAVLVGGMALGAFLTVDVTYLVGSSSDSDNSITFLIGVLIAGLASMYFSYRTFRYGEHYEYRRISAPGDNMLSLSGAFSQVKGIIKDLEDLS